MFSDRREAGKQLARAVARLRLEPPVIVLGLPRGGVPVAYEVARGLAAPLDVMLARKLGAPWQPELALGAIASGGIVVREPLAEQMLARAAVDFDALIERERAELERRERAYRDERPPPDLHGSSVVLVDDGLATGSTMLAAVRAARQAGARCIVAACPVASAEALERIGAEADETVVLALPSFFMAVGQWYRDFDQVEDEEVRRLLAAPDARRAT